MAESTGAEMKQKQVIALLALILTCAAPGAHALTQPTDTDLEDMTHHQQGATSALLVGDHTLLDPGEFSVSADVHVSSWTTDALYGAYGFSGQGKLGDRWALGLSYGETDGQLHTHTWLANGTFALVEGPEPWLHLQTAVGYQLLDSSDSGNVIFYEYGYEWPVQADNPLILLDDIDWAHGYLNLHANTKLWIFRPSMSLGYMYSRYWWSGWEYVVNGLGEEKGQDLSDSGHFETFTWSLGLGLDLGSVRPFMGVGSFKDGGFFLARLTIVF
jgi:hypothetical protein